MGGRGGGGRSAGRYMADYAGMSDRMLQDNLRMIERGLSNTTVNVSTQKELSARRATIVKLLGGRTPSSRITRPYEGEINDSNWWELPMNR